eukprot:TRINITY_DN17537_c0_g1_i1.p1 TRINITY_DN17537_c0_g1~~TRINITY_DN17537_c0_g1_i1.p1  ORF type:complete len:132 (+),score=54.13 TRINITY_DN17537_c0_g1_i1:99-494(+)
MDTASLLSSPSPSTPPQASAAERAARDHTERSGDQPDVRLVASDGRTFVVHARAAELAGTLRALLLTAAFAEGVAREVHFRNIPGDVLEKVVQFLYYKLQHSANADVELLEFPLEPETAMELLMAADFLDA